METFTWTPRTEPTGTVEYRVRTVQFGDGYQQAVGEGLNNRSQSWPLVFLGDEAKIRSIATFLDRHSGSRAFRWTAPLGEPGLFRCKGYQPTAKGGGLYSLSATFEQAFHP